MVNLLTHFFHLKWQKEIEVLKNKLGNVSITPDSVQRLKDGYLQKLNALEKQVQFIFYKNSQGV